jgi:hypothetical protein
MGEKNSPTKKKLHTNKMLFQISSREEKPGVLNFYFSWGLPWLDA